MEPDVNDEVTEYAQYLMKKMRPVPGSATKGFHSCKCKQAHSGSQTYTVSVAGKSYQTNTLLLHYVKNHRSEVPEGELKKLYDGIEYEKQKALNKQLKEQQTEDSKETIKPKRAFKR